MLRLRPQGPGAVRKTGGYPVRVKFSDTDCTGRIYFTAYARWADDAIIEFLRSRRLTYEPAGGLRLDGHLVPETFVIGEYSCRIEHPSHYDDLLRAKVTLLDLRLRTARFQVTIHGPATRKQLARVELVYVCILPSTARSARIPPSVAARLRSAARVSTKHM